jgi:tRNA threonylcarbamoyl adenosine modification protein YeaZ
MVRVRFVALDTSTPATSVTFIDEDAPPRQRLFPPPAKAGDVLPAALGDLADLAGIAVGLGPGSFTGLRVGLACAKAIAYARRIPIAGFSSLQALAVDSAGLVYAATEARKGELFVQAFQDGEPRGEVRIVRAAELRLPEGARLIGPGLAGSAAAVARLCLAQLRGASYDAQACFELAPDYVQGFPAKG